MRITFARFLKHLMKITKAI